MRHAVGNRRRHRRALHAGQADLGERNRHHLRLAIGVAEGLDRPHAVTVIFTSLPVSAGNDTGTVTRRVADLSVGDRGNIDGARLPPASICSCVGTECFPSATTWRSRWSNVTGAGVTTSTHWP